MDRNNSLLRPQPLQPLPAGSGFGGEPPIPSGERPPSAHMRRLQDWFDGHIALNRREAHELLEAAVASGELVREKPHFIAAIKALAAGPQSWGAMGYKLLN
jgi:hypothetical protein